MERSNDRHFQKHFCQKHGLAIMTVFNDVLSSGDVAQAWLLNVQLFYHSADYLSSHRELTTATNMKQMEMELEM